ncbi:N-acetylmuramoyl-L-alanine amidase AmiC precursor [Rickettsiales bacterium Ac37b]|nr:N-acetylmuramoyl-L-alanine amidase AmiC precursor [Rickettsiales bacterium Ac37b]
MEYNIKLIKSLFISIILSFILGNSKTTPVLASKNYRPIVVVDAGHGGKDPGAVGQFSYEKDVTLAYAKLLKRVLERKKRYKVVLTRSEDKYLPLQTRIKKAQQLRSDIFISLHADAHENYSMRGISVYTLSEKASDKEAARLASVENNVDYTFKNFKKEHREIKETLIALLSRNTGNASAEFAHLLVRMFGQKLPLLNNTHRFAGFRVLKGLDTPAVLIELGYLSNDEEELLLHTENYQMLIVGTIERALDKYFSKHFNPARIN